MPNDPAQLAPAPPAPQPSLLAREENAPSRSLKPDEKIPYEVLRMVPQESAEHYSFVPLGVEDNVLEVGMLDPENLQGIDALNFITRKSGMPYKVYRISQADFDAVLKMYQGLSGEVDEALSEQAGVSGAAKQGGFSAEGADEPLDLDDPNAGIQPSEDEKKGKKGELEIRVDAPSIKLASTILRYAIDGKASDVHIEPTAAGVRVRYRVDGTLHTSVVLPIGVHRSLVARIKVLSSIRLDEQRKPQDGRFAAQIDGRKIDFRVSTLPSYYGEKIVIRILDREEGLIPLDTIGLPEEMLRVVREALAQPHGLILISGPTGSGKSTTLYSMLSELNREEKNVLSLEDPIEYNMDGVTQSQVRPEIGYTFANGLRTTLRQDPDIIMVGEIRDGETAKLAIQAALTGHLVLSTIHTNSAVGTIPRLIDMGVEPYLIPPTLILSMAQRLVRKLCPDGGEPTPITESMRDMLSKEFADLPEHRRPAIADTAYEARRTPSCPNGTRGRQAVFEMLPMSSSLERVILKEPIESELWAVARQEGMLTMKEDAILKSFAGEIPFSEVNALGTTLLMDEETDEAIDREREAPVSEAGEADADPTAGMVPQPQTIDLTDESADAEPPKA